MKVGILFPGQGSQYLGMGKELYDRERIVQEYFEQASACLEHNFVRLCFASSEKELKDTVNAQTSIFLLSSALYMLLHKKYGIKPHVVAGHSSGEYAAMFAAGGMSFPDALYLLKKRSLFMEEATREYPGTMIAILGLEYDVLKDICDRYDDPPGIKQVAEIVNYNAPTQLVVSGTENELRLVANDVRQAGGKVLPLNVAGAFHSRMMKDAEEKFSLYMVKVDFKNLTIPMVNNIEAKKVVSSELVKDSLVRQISAHVQWWPAMEQHFKQCDVIIQMGPDSKLAKALKREWKDKQILSLNLADDLQQILTVLNVKMQAGDPTLEEKKPVQK